MTPEQPLFSVVIPTYQRPRLLEEAVLSVLRQTVSNFECVVVDDGSPVPAEVPSDPRVCVVRLPANAGPAAARNAGVAHSRGRYLAFLDDDDLFTPNRLAYALEGLRRAPVTVCWGRDLHAPEGMRSRQRTMCGDVSDTIRDGMTPALGKTALERSAFLPFDERFMAAQDVEWWIRMAQHAPVFTVPRVGLLARRHDAERHINDARQRTNCLEMMLDVHAAYFGAHPRAEAFQWKRIGITAAKTGDLSRATAALARSMAKRPEAATLWHLGRCWMLAAARGRRP